MLNFLEYYKLNENISAETAFIYSIFREKFDDTSILAYADYIQEHKDQEALAIAIRNTIWHKITPTDKNLIQNEGIKSRIKIQYSHTHLRVLGGTISDIFLEGYDVYDTIYPNKKAYCFDSMNYVWKIFENKTSSNVKLHNNDNYIKPRMFRKINIEKVEPYVLVEVVFWERLHLMTYRSYY